MGREVKRVPLDFDFPPGKSFAETYATKALRAHRDVCQKRNHDDCAYCDWRAAIPTGDGWQLWQTVSDGPVSPVFATADELIDWMCQPETRSRPHDPGPYPENPWGQGWRREIAEPFVKRVGWAPTFVDTPQADAAPGAEAAVRKLFSQEMK